MSTRLDKEAEKLTAPSEVMKSLPCSRDMMGLLNHAFSGRGARPLLAVLEARPMVTYSLGVVRVITLVKSFSSFRGIRVRIADEGCQWMFDSLQILSQGEEHLDEAGKSCVIIRTA